jgi:hypothetical protein
MLIFIQKQLQLSTVTKHVEDWGEYISFTVDSRYIFTCVYRNPKSNIKDILSVFTPTLNCNLPMFYVGDWNFEL